MTIEDKGKTQAAWDNIAPAYDELVNPHWFWWRMSLPSISEHPYRKGRS